MPRWVVKCPSCDRTFTHTRIEPAVVQESLRDPFHVLPRPTIPQKTEGRTCPHCRKKSVFKPFELFYRQDDDELDSG